MASMRSANLFQPILREMGSYKCHLIASYSFGQIIREFLKGDSDGEKVLRHIPACGVPVFDGFLHIRRLRIRGSGPW